jgi:hypothetical protein
MLIPGCQVAPFAFTVSPVGAKINEKIFEKRSKPAHIVWELGWAEFFLINCRAMAARAAYYPRAQWKLQADGGIDFAIPLGGKANQNQRSCIKRQFSCWHW